MQGYKVLEHFKISWNNIKTALVAFATVVTTLAPLD
jgi:hypothetical protein